MVEVYFFSRFVHFLIQIKLLNFFINGETPAGLWSACGGESQRHDSRWNELKLLNIERIGLFDPFLQDYLESVLLSSHIHLRGSGISKI